MHLPFSICQLEGIHGSDFAIAISKVILNNHISEPTNIQQKYIDELKNDLEIDLSIRR